IKIEAYGNHVELFKCQSSLFKDQKEELNETSCIVVMDYSTMHETTRFKLKVLNFTLFFKENGALKHRFYDYWSKEKKDFNYYSQALHQFLSNPIFQRFQ